MEQFGIKPENALKRAKDYIAQDQSALALNSLHEVLTNKRFRVWQSSMEDLLMMYVDLCVDQRKGKHAKDGLIQYRQICQQVNVQSLEKVIHHYLEAAEAKGKEAQSSSEEAVKALEGQDLDEEGRGAGDDSPESIIMKAVSGESVKDRTDREILMPWVRFLWEAYRTALDVTRTNIKLEQIFHDTARKAFSFCLRYQRRTEFRRLCEVMRNYLANQTKTSDQRGALQEKPDIFNRFIDTRFKQLNVATSLDLWQDAYKSIEDIHSVITCFKRTPSPKLLLDYFDKLMKVFWVAENYLFHAYAGMKYVKHFFTLKKDQTEEDMRKVADRAVLAVLCVSSWERKNSTRQREEWFAFNINRDKNFKITQLLGGHTVPTRNWLIDEMLGRNILQYASPQLRSLYALLEQSFAPLTICNDVHSNIFPFLDADDELRQYIKPLQKTVVVRMLEQIATVYTNIALDQLVKMCPYLTEQQMESTVLELAKNDNMDLHVQICHRTRTVTFSDQLFDFDLLTSQLTRFNTALRPIVSKCRELVEPIGRPDRSKEVLRAIGDELKQEREDITERLKVIEARKHLQEQKEQEDVKRAEELAKEQQTKLQQMEEDRNKQLKIKRQQEQEANEKTKLELEAVRRLHYNVAAAAGTTSVKKPVENAISTENKLSKDEMLTEAKKLLIRQRAEREKRLDDEAKRVEFLERAHREAEKPLLLKEWDSKQERLRQQSVDDAAEKEKLHKSNWEIAIEEKTRLMRMEPWWTKFRDSVLKDADVDDEEEEREEINVDEEDEEA